MNDPIDTQCIIQFPSEEIRDAFLGWFSDGGGESQAYDSLQMHRDVNVIFDYSRCFPAWGYDKEKHGVPTIDITICEEGA